MASPFGKQFGCLTILQKNQCFIASDRNHAWFEKATVRLGVSLVTKWKWNEKDQGAPLCASPGSPGAFAPVCLAQHLQPFRGTWPAAHLPCLCLLGTPSLRSGRALLESKHSSDLEDKCQE